LTAYAASWPAHRQRYRRRRQTTDTSEQNSTGPVKDGLQIIYL